MNTQPLEDLATDGVLTAGQAVRRWGYRTVKTLVGSGLVTVRRAQYRPTAGSRKSITVPVLCLSERGVRTVLAEGLEPWCPPGRELAHAIGLAELRFRLGIPARDLVRTRRHARWKEHEKIPDALYRTGSGLIALEYDHGKYTARQVASKLAAAPLFSDRMIWGVPGAKRARWLEKHGAEEVIVLEVPLWP